MAVCCYAGRCANHTILPAALTIKGQRLACMDMACRAGVSVGSAWVLQAGFWSHASRRSPQLAGKQASVPHMHSYCTARGSPCVAWGA